MQFWPRKRAARIYPRVRSWKIVDQARPLGFAAYKVGMTHIIVTDNRKTSKTKGESISMPVTVLECPPLKVASVRFYKTTKHGFNVVKEVHAAVDKEFARKANIAKKVGSLDGINAKEYSDIRLQVYTQPKMTGFGKKIPEVFELGLGGKIDEKYALVQKLFGKEILVKDVFKEGQQIDIHAVTKGKGYQGPVKRFGVAIRSHKAEKTKRGPGSLGGWRGQGHIMYRVAHAGQMGFHTRTEWNKQIIKIGDKDEINKDGGYHRYGNVKSSYMMLKGSVAGPAKRMVRLVVAERRNKKYSEEVPSIEYIHK